MHVGGNALSAAMMEISIGGFSKTKMKTAIRSCCTTPEYVTEGVSVSTFQSHGTATVTWQHDGQAMESAEVPIH
jgi:hypothetical protein